MIGWIVLGCILLFFIFLLSLKAVITIGYSDGITLTIRVLFFKIKILPKKEKKKGPHSMSASKAQKIRKKLVKKEKAKREKKAQKALQKKQAPPKPKKSVAEILDLIAMVRKLVAAVVKCFFKHLRIDIARLKIKIATGDAASTAIAYGAVTQAVNVLFPLLEPIKNFGLPETTELDIQPDFLSESSEMDILLSFSLRVWHVFDIAFSALGAFFKHKFSKT